MKDTIEALQIQPTGKKIVEADKPRQSTRPLAVHSRAADEYLELRSAQAEMERQAGAILAMAADKARLAGTLERDLMGYAQEYKDRTIRTKKILMQLETVPPHMSKTPTWTAFREWAFKKFGAISKDMEKEAREFLESTKREVPGSDVLNWAELRGESIMGSAWKHFKLMLTKLKNMATKSDTEISKLEAGMAKLDVLQKEDKANVTEDEYDDEAENVDKATKKICVF